MKLMEVIQAVRKLSRLEENIDKLDKWLLEVEHGKGENQKPFNGAYWRKIRSSILNAMEEMQDESNTLETK